MEANMLEKVIKKENEMLREQSELFSFSSS